MAAGPQFEEQFVGLFGEKYDALRRYLILLGLSREDAEDAAQETFMRLHKHLKSGRGRENLEGWLVKVARNIARDELRSRRRNMPLERTEWQTEDLLRDPVESPEIRLLNGEKLARLQTAMAQLTPQQAECFRLRVAGLRYREIADAMDIGISAVGELIQRAMARLKEASDV